MTQPRVADDFAMIRARLEELRRERERAERGEKGLNQTKLGRPSQRTAGPLS